MNKQMDINDIEDLQADLQDQQAEIEERQEFFINAGKEGEEDALAELDELEALAAEEEMEAEMGMVSNAPINVPGQAQANP